MATAAIMLAIIRWSSMLTIAPSSPLAMDLLLDAIRSEMKEQNGLELRLYVHENNQAAIKAYGKANFTFSKYRIMIQK
jgi:hypothetical protein